MSSRRWGAVGDGCWEEVERMTCISPAKEHCGGRGAPAVVRVRVETMERNKLVST
jgi:hypothetical protein